jgi:hypothetical protein
VFANSSRVCGLGSSLHSTRTSLGPNGEPLPSSRP